MDQEQLNRIEQKLDTILHLELRKLNNSIACMTPTNTRPIVKSATQSTATWLRSQIE